jgi:hypothetical protein
VTWLYDRGLTLALLAMFSVSFVAQIASGRRELNDVRRL